ILLITPPFTQLNTPYPGTGYLKAFLNTKNISSYQYDVGMEVMLQLFSKKGLQNSFEYMDSNAIELGENEQRSVALKDSYVRSVGAVISFVQGKHPTLANAIVHDDFLHQASRFSHLDDLDWAFGSMGFQDKAKHYATLYLEDISDLIIETVDENFGFSRYAERLGRSTNSFDELYQKLHDEPTYIDQITLCLLDDLIQRTNPKIVGFSVPFPGNLYSAFRSAQYIKQYHPHIRVVMGGGFPNTELRSVSDVRVFE